MDLYARGMLFLALAVAAVPVFSQEQSSPRGGNDMFTMILMMGGIFAVVYFLMIRPEQQKQKKRQSMIAEVKKGDKVMTIGGILGTIQSVKDTSLTVKIAEGTVVEMKKSAISEVVTNGKSDKNGKS